MKNKKPLLIAGALLVTTTLGTGGFYGYRFYQHWHADDQVAPVTAPVAATNATQDATDNPAPVNRRPIAIDREWLSANQAVDFWNNIEDARADKVPQPDHVIEKMMADADAAVNKGDIYDGREKLRNALKDGGNKPDLWVKFADSAQATQDTYSATAAYLIAEALDPDKDEKLALYRGLAKIFMNTNDPALRPQAVRALEKALDISSDSDLKNELDILKGNVLAFKQSTLRSDNDLPEACLEFSQTLNEDGKVAYENFIAIKPKIKVSAVPVGNQLCLKGFAYGQDYQITLKSGLPSAGPLKLLKNEEIPVTFANRKPTLAFQDDTYILPRFNNVGVPLRGLNVDVAWVQILQINDRNLVNQMIDGSVFDKTLYNYEKSQLENDRGRSLWQGFLNVRNVNNKSVTTAIPFNDLIKDPVPGLYAIVAQPAIEKSDSERADDALNTDKSRIIDADYTVNYEDKIVQWLVVTDIGLTTYTGQDGMQVTAHSYSSGNPVSGVKLRLLSRDNTIIAESTTDSAGHVTFGESLLRGEGGKQEKLLQAFNGKGDFTFLDVQQPSLDFSDRGVEGRDAVTKLDAFIYSDRAIYRPGDTMHLSALVRDTNAKALDNAPPVTVKIFRPDGVLFSQSIVKPHDMTLGGYHISMVIADNARMGVWRAELFADPTEPAIGSYTWQVEDFVPARIDVKVAVPKDAMLDADKALDVPVQADYLYGAPAADSRGDATLNVRFAESTLFDKYKDYTFGAFDADFTTEQSPLVMDKTNDKGQSKVSVKLETIPAVSRPLEALLRVSVFDDSNRAVNRTAIIPVNRTEAFLGLKELATGTDDVDNDWNFSADRSFSIVAVNRQGTAVKQDKLHYRLVKEQYHYDWYAAEGERNYQGQVYDVPVKTGDLNIAANQPGEVDFSGLDYGTYRLDVFDPTQTTDRLTFVSTKFNVGWTQRAFTSKDKPDALQLRLDKAHYNVGETAQLFIKAPFGGQAELILARENVLDRRPVTLSKDGTTVEIPVTNTWGPGVYALVHAYRAGEKAVIGETKTIPGRAVGVIWMGLDPKPRTVDIAMDVPEQITPRQTLTVPVTLSGDGPMEVTLAAVDEGILQLTAFKTPDPDGHFYAKRKLAVDVRDTYGRLLDPHADAIGQVRVGGDQAGRTGANLPSRWIKPLALFSGPVTVDGNGQAKIELPIPAFNGKIRLMAVAYNKRQVGHAEQDVIVRDPVIVNLGLPRFMAVKDKADLHLTLNNLDGAAGKAKIQLTTTGGLKLNAYPKTVTLEKQKKADLPLELTAVDNGPGSVRLQVQFADGGTFDQVWPLTVRPIQSYQTTVKTGTLAPGKTITLNNDLLKNKVASDAIVSVAVNPSPDLQLPRILKELDRYPYGCLEQTSSRLLPLLYLRDLSQQGVNNKTQSSDQIINDAIEHIFSMQRSDGSFSLWNGYGDTEEFLSLYAIDVLQRAQEQGYKVPDYALQRALGWLKRTVKLSDYSLAIMHRRAYAYYLLAKAGLVEPGEVRYFVERHRDNFSTAITNGFVAAALTQIGDAQDAKTYWQKAVALSDNKKDKSKDDYYYDYGSLLRDRLIILTLAAEAKVTDIDVLNYADHVNGALSRQSYLSTQEEGWAILAVHGLYQNNESMQISINDKAVEMKPNQPLLQTWQNKTLQDLQQGQVIRNDGEKGLYYTTSVNAISMTMLPAVENGFKLSRTFYTRDGKEADLKAIKANDMIIAVIEGQVTDDRIVDQALLVDLLPAGFELENAQFGEGESLQNYAWIGALSASAYQELRDDRFVVAFDPKVLLNNSNAYQNDNAETKVKKPLANNQFRFAYALRAVTPGHYQVPAIAVESMYRPEFQARTEPTAMDVR